jgi:hypothetical protein
MKLALSFFAILPVFALAACSATTSDDASTQDPSAEAQDEEIKKSITSCDVDADCVAVPTGGCCEHGWKTAVNKHHVRVYENATKCTQNPRPFCPMFIVNDTRIAACDASAHQCKMVASAASIQGQWGATGATMDVTNGEASLEFGCGQASIDSFSFSDPQDFTGTGLYTGGMGVVRPGGFGPPPQPATFTGQVSGNTLTLTMKVAGNSTTYVFTRNRQITLMRCL